MLYLTVILISSLLITALDFSLAYQPDPAVALLSALHTLSAVAAVFLLDAITAFLVRRLPSRLFAPTHDAFAVSEGERRLLRRLGVPKWKDRIPEWGACSGFRKNELRSASDSEYLGRFLMESNYGVVIHLVNLAVGFLLIPLPFVGGLAVGLPVAAVNGVLALLPVMILRYNTPPLRRIYQRALKKEQRA